jgi:hypothetical protein
MNQRRGQSSSSANTQSSLSANTQSSLSANVQRPPLVQFFDKGDKVKYNDIVYFVTKVEGRVKKTYTLCKTEACDPPETPIEGVTADKLQKVSS